jgi:hypothetical protein
MGLKPEKILEMQGLIGKKVGTLQPTNILGFFVS